MSRSLNINTVMMVMVIDDDDDDDDNEYDIIDMGKDYGAMKMEFFFKLGEPFDYTGADGTKAKCTVTLEGENKLVDRYKTPEGASWQTVRVVDKSAGLMKTTTTFDGFPAVACVQQLVRL
ncbi:fatty acid-binding protein, muscle [Plakobranchus ocellatus]|uniref:Fatty acid-binding protein, muscle n=1 Tax=Plakobranchus ocellatus TaxID=259542 RepID=A0AAV3YC99_9GAST|nr:fatty acid-binding protein, muscle [Plakobranchus ocellatus]